MTATVALATTADAESLAQLLRPHGIRVDVDGTAVTLTADALDVLADLDEDHDGVFDGEFVWVGGTEYRVTR